MAHSLHTHLIGLLCCLQERCAIDFADMIPLTIHLFKRYRPRRSSQGAETSAAWRVCSASRRPDVLAEVQATYKYVFCDEYQGEPLTVGALWLLARHCDPAIASMADVTKDQFEVLVYICGKSKHITICGE